MTPHNPINQLEADQLNQILGNWKLTPATFAHKISSGSWIPARHLQIISAKIARAIARGNARIILSMPPRHGKSELVSVYTPAWLLEVFGRLNIILCSYNADLAEGFSRKVRDLITDNEALLDIRIRKDLGRSDMFGTTKGGLMSAVGLGGAITGKGAHVLLIDDYIKEIKEALSPAHRDYIWNWFVTTAYTRIEPGGSCIIIATRWHSDDLIGRLLASQRDKWEYIEIPAIAEKNDYLGRTPGSALFNERYPIEKLHEIRDTLGTIFFQALYQQKPVDETRRMANSKWLKIVDSIPANLKMIRVWDLAATEDGGDYTVGTLMGYDASTGNVYIPNVIRDQLSPEQVESKVQRTAEADGTFVDVGVEQEPGSSGKALVNHYERNVLGSDYKVVPIPATKHKVIRAQPFLAAAEAGKVHLLRGDWNASFIDEFDKFPGGEFDDQVDTASGAYTQLTGKKAFSASWGRDRPGSNTANSRMIRAQQAQFSLASGRIRGATFGRR